MNIILKIEMLIVSLLMIIIIVHTLKTKIMNIKYSILWLIMPVIYVLFAIFSEPMIKFANALGFEVLSNMIFFLTFGMLFAICFSLTIIVSKLNKRVVELTQEISLLKSKGDK